LESKPIIYASYMSFLEYGGVFIPSNDKFHMGEEVLLVLELVGPAKTEKLFIKTNVCWINANPSGSGRPPAAAKPQHGHRCTHAWECRFRQGGIARLLLCKVLMSKSNP